MGVRNYVVTGVSCSGKTSVCEELLRRGYRAIHGDRELAYWGDPVTGGPVETKAFEHWIWHVDRVTELVADRTGPVTFFCGGCRNLDHLRNLMDGLFVLQIDEETLKRRLAQRPDSEWSGSPTEGRARALEEQADSELPEGAVPIDATAPLAEVVETILTRCGLPEP